MATVLLARDPTLDVLRLAIDRVSTVGYGLAVDLDKADGCGGERVLVADVESGVARPVRPRNLLFISCDNLVRCFFVGGGVLGSRLVLRSISSLSESSYSEPLLDSEYRRVRS